MKNMLSHKNIQLFLNQKGKLIFKNKSIFFQNKLICSPIVFCGAIDELFNYKFGKLPYRSLNINFIHYNKNSYQKNAVINYPAHAKITRITEYKKLTQQRINGTTISKETPGEYSSKSKNFNHRFYPINNIFTSKIYNSYYKLASKFKNLYLLGRLAQYKYFDMDDAIFNALELSQKIINNYE
jgi:UDP-galactopyranose mutase